VDLTSNLCNCNEDKLYSDKYDAYYCKVCNKWAEDKCSDPTCEYCTTRPDQPEMRDNV